MFILHNIPGVCPKKAQQAQRLWSHLDPEELTAGGERGAVELLPTCTSVLAHAGPQAAVCSLGAGMEAPLLTSVTDLTHQQGGAGSLSVGYSAKLCTI